ncbi:MAG: LysR family transcriptional regulator [Proteobacteria bacterium]|nr:LysR family transcriptional regulator [Pseudomonadota bacterium]
MDWDDLRHFLALARTRSVRAAGAVLGVSHSTVARRVEALEARLSTRLFDRSRDGYALTDAGERMLETAERVEGEMAALERGLVGQDERLAGVVAVTCCDHYVSGLLMPKLSAFCAMHPEIELSFNTDSRPFDLSKREADLALRMLARDRLPPEHLIGQKLVPLTMASYVAQAHETRLDPDVAGSQARWISFEDRKIHAGLIASSSYPDLPAWGSFTSLELMAQAATEGLGLAMLPTYVGDQKPELRRLAKPDLRQLADLWLVSHPDLRDNARFRATRQTVAAAIRSLSPLFEGLAPWSTDAPGRPKITPDRMDDCAVP